MGLFVPPAVSLPAGYYGEVGRGAHARHRKRPAGRSGCRGPRCRFTGPAVSPTHQSAAARTPHGDTKAPCGAPGPAASWRRPGSRPAASD